MVVRSVVIVLAFLHDNWVRVIEWPVGIDCIAMTPVTCKVLQCMHNDTKNIRITRHDDVTARLAVIN